MNEEIGAYEVQQAIDEHETKCQNRIEQQLEEIHRLIEKISDRENERIEKYGESNTKLAMLEKKIEELETKIEGKGQKVAFWVIFGFAILEGLYLVISNYGG